MQVVYAKYTSWVSPSVQIIEGEAWRADDPVVRRHPDKFAELPKVVRTTLPRHLRTEPVVEQATAAPGEKRSTRRPRKKAAETPTGEDQVPQVDAEQMAEGDADGE